MRRTVVTILSVVVAALVLPALASAQTPVPTPTATPTPPAPAPAPAAAKIAIKVDGAHRVGRNQVALRGDKLRVRGFVSPFVAGQKVVVRITRGAKTLRSKTVAIRQSGANGVFLVALKAAEGTFSVRAIHKGTPQQAAAKAAPAKLLGIVPHAGFGARGPAVRVLQTRLSTLHYAVSRSGRFDDSTGRAVIAYRKMRGWARVAVASSDVFRGLLAGKGTFKAKYPSHGKHVEADLSRQVLVLLHGAKVDRIYTVSSGKASTPTVLGRFKVYSQQLGTNAKGMVDTSYFIGGYAIHGYHDVPTFPASHGCLRVPIPNALSIYRWLSLGDRVDVYP
jgi:peptidoglycan hydrolase-like protein with peptidoglycan-binding domain